MNKIKKIFIFLSVAALIFSVLPTKSAFAAATPEITLGTNPELYANGTALIITAGATANHTTVYIDANANGILDTGEVSLAAAGIVNAPADDSDLSAWRIHGGASTAYASGSPYVGNTLLTMTGGKIDLLYGNGAGADLTGSATVNIYGGEVATAGIGTYDVSGSKTINIKGETKINSLWVAQCTGGKATIVGELTGSAHIRITCNNTHTVVAQTAAGVDTSYADASKFDLTYNAGYYIAASGGTPYPLGTLYMLPNGYNITYELNGGSAGTNAPTSALTADVFSVSAPTKANCTFLGWRVNCLLYPTFGGFAKYGNTSAEATTALTYETTLCINSVNAANDVYFTNLSSVAGAEIVLTAVWREPLTGVSISPAAPKVGDVLTCATTPTNASVSYSWKVNGSEVGTLNSYTVAAGDVGYPINLTVSGTGNYTGSADAAPTQPVTALAVNASVIQSAANYDKHTAVTGVGFTVNLGSYTLTAVRNGGSTLAPNTDYTVSSAPGASVCTVNQSYLNAQAEGPLTLTFVMNGGTNPTAVITVSDSNPGTITPVSNAPKTGDDLGLMPALFSLIISAAGMLFIKRRFDGRKS